MVADNDLYLSMLAPTSVHLLQSVDAMVVPYSRRAEVNAEQVSAMRHLLITNQQFVTGSLLVKNPYSAESYTSADSAMESFALAKYEILVNLVRLLGAREIKIDQTTFDQTHEDWTARLAAQLPQGKGSAKVRREITKRLRARLEGLTEFPGGEPAIDEAREHLVRSNLQNDPQMRSLIDLRTGDNKVKSYKRLISGTQEAISNFESALRIANAGPVRALSIGAGFVRSVESISSIEIETTISF